MLFILTCDKRKIEFITTTRIFEELINTKSNILDCAAGTGIYSFWLADQGHLVTATDITPRHIKVINNELKTKDYNMNTSVLDATNMSIFADETFAFGLIHITLLKKKWNQYMQATT